MSQLPYQTPNVSTPLPEVVVKEHDLQLVSQGKRFVNYLVDRVLMTIGVVGLGLVIGVVLAIVDPDSVAVDDAMVDVIGYVVGFTFIFVYFVFFESLFHKSPDKFLTGTKVVNKDGGVPTFGQILGRSACRFIPFEAFSFLFGDSDRVVGWHDQFSGTRVVRAE